MNDEIYDCIVETTYMYGVRVTLGGYSPYIGSIWIFAAGKGMVFKPFSLG